MIIETLSTFPDMYESVMGASMMRIAQEKGILDFKAHDLRDWTHDRHRTTDDEVRPHLRSLRIAVRRNGQRLCFGPCRIGPGGGRCRFC